MYSSSVHGDPSTPVFRAYSKDPVVVRNVDGSHEEVHTFNLHGHRWLSQPDNPDSAIVNNQTLSLAEYFNYEIQSGVPRKAAKSVKDKRAAAGVGTDNGGVSLVVNGAGQPGDYLYGSSSLDDQWLGMWGIFRISNQAQPTFMSTTRNVAARAITIPTAAMVLPERAVAGFRRRLIPTMNSTAATR